MEIPIGRVNEIVKGKRGITAETAWLLAEYFDTPVEFWAGLQQHYDLCRGGYAVAEKLKRVHSVRRQGTKQSD